jgi:hypothetical protein
MKKAFFTFEKFGSHFSALKLQHDLCPSSLGADCRGLKEAEVCTWSISMG